MSLIEFNHQLYSLTSQETVLQCLLRHGVEYPNACQAGICRSCLMKSKGGEVHPSWQEGLPNSLKSQGYFLACLAKPVDLLQVIVPDESECEVEAKIIGIQPLNQNVIQVQLEVDNLESWAPGQYLSLITPEGTVRSYSIANIPRQEGLIELHIKIYPGGCMGHWLLSIAKAPPTVKLRGPFGYCVYENPNQLSFDLLLAGTGTGLAPLVGILKDALSQGHQGRITLVHGGLTDDDLYYQEELEKLSAVFHNFVYDPCVLKSQGRYPEASIEKRILAHIQQPLATRAYVCGPKETTNRLKKQIFLAGVPSQAILSDAFL